MLPPLLCREVLILPVKLCEPHSRGHKRQKILLGQALALANNIAEAAPFALKLTKRSLNRAMDMQGFRTALQAHFDTHQLSHVSESFMEAKREGRRKTIDMNRELKI